MCSVFFNIIMKHGCIKIMIMETKEYILSLDTDQLYEIL